MKTSLTIRETGILKVKQQCIKGHNQQREKATQGIGKKYFQIIYLIRT